MASGFLFGETQDFFCGSWQEGGSGGILALKCIGGRDRREQQHGNLELQCQLRSGSQSLFMFVGAVHGHENVVKRIVHLAPFVRLNQQHGHAGHGR